MRTVQSKMLEIACNALQGRIKKTNTDDLLIAAILLNRHDWLTECGFTFTEALRHLGKERVLQITQVAKELDIQCAENKLRYAFEILKNGAKGGGYYLRLLDNGQEIAKSLFPASGKSVCFANDELAYDEAFAAGNAWIEAKQANSIHRHLN